MDINNLVRNPIFEKDGIVFLNKEKYFAYSDGDRLENYILQVIHGCQDVSSESRELETFIKDWPTRYHLSRERSLGYRSLNIDRSSQILEVGCGCGSITRLLGERGGTVVALEGSPRRAKITRERTRDLANVKVLCGSFEDVEFSQKFDIIVCNGVLEYAALFVDDVEPHSKMIGLLAALLAPGGSVIIAIENKFGLRYFSSGREEHTNIMFDGIEGYPRKPCGPHTFGAAELDDILRVHLSYVEILFPLPDYKLPTALVRKKLVQSVNCAELFSNTMSHNFGSFVKPKMHERLVWHELQRNRLLSDFANSFFVIAGDSETSLIDPEWLGDIYSIRRKPNWTVRTKVFGGGEGVTTSKSYYEPSSVRSSDGRLIHHTAVRKWEDGDSIHTLLVRALLQKRSGSLVDSLRRPVSEWWDAVLEHSTDVSPLSGVVLDYNWRNALVTKDGVTFIDSEWEWAESVEPSWLIYRVVANFINHEACFAHRWGRNGKSISKYLMIKAIGRIVGVEFSLPQLIVAVRREAEFQALVAGGKVGKYQLTVRLIDLVEPLWIQRVRSGLKVTFRRFRSKMGRLVWS